MPPPTTMMRLVRCAGSATSSPAAPTIADEPASFRMPRRVRFEFNPTEFTELTKWVNALASAPHDSFDFVNFVNSVQLISGIQMPFRVRFEFNPTEFTELTKMGECLGFRSS